MRDVLVRSTTRVTCINACACCVRGWYACDMCTCMCLWIYSRMCVCVYMCVWSLVSTKNIYNILNSSDRYVDSWFKNLKLIELYSTILLRDEEGFVVPTGENKGAIGALDFFVYTDHIYIIYIYFLYSYLYMFNLYIFTWSATIRLLTQARARMDHRVEITLTEDH